MNFGLIFYTVVEPIIVYIKIFYLKFFETLKCHFQFFLENGLHEARAPLEVSREAPHKVHADRLYIYSRRSRSRAYMDRSWREHIYTS
jgi:hypothetical protein